jgi:hypothetical protein
MVMAALARMPGPFGGASGSYAGFDRWGRLGVKARLVIGGALPATQRHMP